jgi:hypothetical protein
MQNGGNLGRNVAEGAIIGAISGAVTGGIPPLSNVYVNVAVHISAGALTGGIISDAMGGNFGDGFTIGAISAAISIGMQKALTKKPEPAYKEAPWQKEARELKAKYGKPKQPGSIEFADTRGIMTKVGPNGQSVPLILDTETGEYSLGFPNTNATYGITLTRWDILDRALDTLSTIPLKGKSPFYFNMDEINPYLDNYFKQHPLRPSTPSR